MSNLGKQNNSKEEITDNIQNQKMNNEIDLVSSEQRVVNAMDISISTENQKNNTIINDNLNNSINNSTKEKQIDLFCGSPYEIKYPKKLGNLRIILYIKDFPLIVIGKDCKFIFLIFHLISSVK